MAVPSLGLDENTGTRSHGDGASSVAATPGADSLPQWKCRGVSPDGRILGGWGVGALGLRGYIVILGSNRVMP